MDNIFMILKKQMSAIRQIQKTILLHQNLRKTN